MPVSRKTGPIKKLQITVIGFALNVCSRMLVLFILRSYVQDVTFTRLYTISDQYIYEGGMMYFFMLSSGCSIGSLDPETKQAREERSLLLSVCFPA